MLKNNRQMYHFNGGLYNLNSLAAYYAQMNAAGDILGFLCCDDVRDIELSDALNKLVAIIAEGLANGTIQMDESVRKEILNWYVSQPGFIQLICGKQMADAKLLASTEQNDTKMSTVA